MNKILKENTTFMKINNFQDINSIVVTLKEWMN